MKTLIPLQQPQVTRHSADKDHPYLKGDRIVAKIAPNEWYLGTVVRVGAKIKILFDDGHEARVDADDFKDIRAMAKPRKLKRALTNKEAFAVYSTAPPKVLAPPRNPERINVVVKSLTINKAFVETLTKSVLEPKPEGKYGLPRLAAQTMRNYLTKIGWHMQDPKSAGSYSYYTFKGPDHSVFLKIGKRKGMTDNLIKVTQ